MIIIKQEFFDLIRDKFRVYSNAKSDLDQRILDNHKWFKSQHVTDNDPHMPLPVTGHLFNTLCSKHADAMDNFPEASIFERQPDDLEEAEALSNIMPTILDNAKFKKTYSRAWWYKLKNGACCYGVFFNPQKGEVGEIDIKCIDLLNLFWEPGVIDIQDSPFLFITSLVDSEYLRKRYKKDVFSGMPGFQVRSYTHIPEVHTDKSLVVDCYYKKPDKNGEMLLHLVKYCGDVILESSEDLNPHKSFYEHGQYPVVIDSLYPEEDSPVGFGVIDIAKNPQMYIDKLDEIISRNALISGKMRWLIKDNGGVNEQELTNMQNDIIHVSGGLDELNIRQFQAKPLDSFIMYHRQNKIAELKEITGNRDTQQGGSVPGVTSGSAIMALQQSGEKLSRDMISNFYESFKDIVYFIIELIRQFYDEPRYYRIQTRSGEKKFISHNNDYLRGHRNASFDIDVSIERRNPFSKIEHNRLMMELWRMGIFSAETAVPAQVFLDNLQIDGKEKLLASLKELYEKPPEDTDTANLQLNTNPPD